MRRGFTGLGDKRLVYRGNKILSDLFSKSVHSIRQLSRNESDAKAVYRFLQNDRVSEGDIVENLVHNCQMACAGKFVVCIQDTTEVNLSSHGNRINKDGFVGTTNAKNSQGLGFFIHPSLVLDAVSGTPYGYSDIKIWNRPLEFASKHERQYGKLPIEEKESYKWIEVSKNTQASLRGVVAGMVIVQDREGDIYEQFATIPDAQTDLLIRARTDRTLADGSKLFSCLADQPYQGSYEVQVDACAKTRRKKRIAKIEIRYKEVELKRTRAASKAVAPSIKLYLVEAKEANRTGPDRVCWRLLTSLPIETLEMAEMCVEWYKWRWTIEEVFKILKKEGYNIEASELEYGSSVRKLSLLIMEVIIKLFLMRLAYAVPEGEMSADSCFTEEEQTFLEHQIIRLEGRTEKQKNPYKEKGLKRYVWAIARLGGWKGYESKRHPGITTLWIGLKYFKAAMEGWTIHKDVSTR
ncbi:DDE family transposase [Gillisia sp. Hel_I_86]|uniref:IS4 family transposase n=1 Tax=Gillisia sp. Hel_I_86 TaxID=1249981 RepID=UPI00119B19C3|nr:IS4 family transposase [Gillisia sp. Hel_I_86]TVZ25797.1 DDE family transposase [Gillisia sp. Hel_I_86]TVZ26323.1 DDE family transposase [Gillisia sp. Hel_I_86]TVZ26635.1 DDE family transposase [Gillisia sp. Hel_I_86]TVZ26860.1 DDE family transposase [Gillisia sp. Hel_I_86]TVZ27055.1 DDE family transposase [Gillisia sp. Hel_I_86]